MATTYELIKGETLTGSAASYTFSAIPSTFQDLVLKVSARGDDAGIPQQIWLRFNGDTNTVYSYNALSGNGSAASAAIGSSLASTRALAAAAGNGATANTFGNADIYIPSYTATQNKPIGSFGTGENNATTSNIAASAGLWGNTAAITSITLLPASATNWLTNSSFYLYGIKKS